MRKSATPKSLEMRGNKALFFARVLGGGGGGLPRRRPGAFWGVSDRPGNSLLNPALRVTGEKGEMKGEIKWPCLQVTRLGFYKGEFGGPFNLFGHY